MKTRSPQSIAAILEVLSLEKNEERNTIQVISLGTGAKKQSIQVTEDRTLLLNPDEQKKNSPLPLTKAAWLEKTLEALSLKKEDSVNTQACINGKGTTLLIQAIQSTAPDRLRLIKVLLDHGANPALTDDDGNNAFVHAAQGGYNSILILKELLSLVQNDDSRPEETKKITAEKEPATKNIEQKTEKTTTETTTITGTATKQKQPVEKTTLRVKLTPEVLSKKNNKGETIEIEQLVLSAMGQITTPAVNKSSAPKESPQKQLASNPLERLKTLVENLAVVQTQTVPVKKITIRPTSPPGAIKASRSEAQEKAENIASNNDWFKKEQAIRQQYDKLCKSKLSFFNTQCWQQLAADKKQRQAAQKRALIRHQLQHHYGLILFVTDEEVSLDTLEQLSKASNYEPILIKNGEHFSIYGADPHKLDGYSGSWILSPLDEFEKATLQGNKLLAEFEKIAVGKSQFIKPEDPLLIANTSLKGIINPHHAPNLNLKKQPHYDIEIEAPSGKPVLPVSYSDQAAIRAAFISIEDYFAPKSAPLPHCLRWGALRRLLTGNLGRRYCADAEKLYTGFNTCPLETTSDIMALHLTVKGKLAAMNMLPHDKKECNTIFNSPYTQRLYCILKTLEETEAYKQEVTCKLALDEYLDEVDRQNSFTPQ